MCDEYKKDYLNADIIDLKEKFGDNRGFIQPLCDLNMKSASLIYTKADQFTKTGWKSREKKRAFCRGASRRRDRSNNQRSPEPADRIHKRRCDTKQTVVH